jgi:hypothetical protein
LAFYLFKPDNYSRNQLKKLSFRNAYAAITNIHLTEPQVLQGGKVSVFDSGIRDFSPLLLQKCSYNPDSGHFSPVLWNFLLGFLITAFFSGIDIRQTPFWYGLALKPLPTVIN